MTLEKLADLLNPLKERSKCQNLRLCKAYKLPRKLHSLELIGDHLGSSGISRDHLRTHMRLTKAYQQKITNLKPLGNKHEHCCQNNSLNE